VGGLRRCGARRFIVLVDRPKRASLQDNAPFDGWMSKTCPGRASINLEIRCGTLSITLESRNAFCFLPYSTVDDLHAVEAINHIKLLIEIISCVWIRFLLPVTRAPDPKQDDTENCSLGRTRMYDDLSHFCRTQQPWPIHAMHDSNNSYMILCEPPGIGKSYQIMPPSIVRSRLRRE
jgi:hypothetical protein